MSPAPKTPEELQLELERLRLQDKDAERRHEERRTSIDMRWRFAYLLVGLVGGSAGTAGTFTLFGGADPAPVAAPAPQTYDTQDTGP